MTRCLFVCAALLVFAPGAFGGGEYQHTRDGKTLVWNNDPKPGEEAAWFGDRDGEGYATGFGTLTWYAGRREPVRRLGIPVPLTGSKIYARYFGNMVSGKFNGPVNVHRDGKTAHALFIDGVRSSPWAVGRAPSRMPQSRAKVAKQGGAAEFASAKPSNVAETVAPTESPKAGAVEKKGEAGRPQLRAETPSTSVRSEQADDAKKSRSEPASPPTRRKKSQPEVEASLSSLVGPPSSLHTNPVADGSSAAANREEAQYSTDARLTKEEVVNLADAEARARGYSPAEYGRVEPQYNSVDEIWSINYQALDQTMENGQRFSVTVDDKTKGIVFVPGK